MPTKKVGDTITDWRESRQGLAAVRDFGPADVRSGSQPELRSTALCQLWPAADTPRQIRLRQHRAMRRPEQMQQNSLGSSYSMTSSARARSVGGTSMPIALAA